MENVFKFQHDAEKINLALGLSDELDLKCLDIIVFSTISNHLISEELFDSKDLAPKSLTTISGDLEKALSLCSNEDEKNYVLLIFKQTHDMAVEVVAKYKALNEADPREKLKMELVMKLLDFRIDDIASQVGAEHLRLTPSNLFKRLDYVKKSRYNFEKYLSLVNNKADDILKNIFKEDE